MWKPCYNELFFLWVFHCANRAPFFAAHFTRFLPFLPLASTVFILLHIVHFLLSNFFGGRNHTIYAIPVTWTEPKSVCKIYMLEYMHAIKPKVFLVPKANVLLIWIKFLTGKGFCLLFCVFEVVVGFSDSIQMFCKHSLSGLHKQVEIWYTKFNLCETRKNTHMQESMFSRFLA